MKTKTVRMSTKLRKSGERDLAAGDSIVTAFESSSNSVKARNPMVIHYVHDMARAARFYKEVFGLEADFESEGWTTFNFGELALALHGLPSGREGILPHAGLNLEVDNIEEMQAAVEALGGRLVELREAGGNVPVRVACFVDSEGNGFELRQQPGFRTM